MGWHGNSLIVVTYCYESNRGKQYSEAGKPHHDEVEPLSGEVKLL